MKAEPQNTPQRWVREGTQAEQTTADAMRQCEHYYQPEHGSLPGPHERAATSSWPGTMTETPGVDVPGGMAGKGQHVPFPNRRVQFQPSKQLPTKPGNGPFEGIWAGGKGKK